MSTWPRLDQVSARSRPLPATRPLLSLGSVALFSFLAALMALSGLGGAISFTLHSAAPGLPGEASSHSGRASSGALTGPSLPDASTGSGVAAVVGGGAPAHAAPGPSPVAGAADANPSLGAAVPASLSSAKGDAKDLALSGARPEAATSTGLLGSIAVGTNPAAVGVDSATNTLYVANAGSATVSVIDGATNVVTATIPVGTGPNAVAVDSATNTVYVTNYLSNSVSVIDGATNVLTATVPVGQGPDGVDVNLVTDTVYVANNGSNTVSVVNGTTYTVSATLQVGTNPVGVGVDSATDTVYVANSGSSNVSVIDGATNAVTQAIPVQSVPIGVGVDPATDTLYVGNYNSNTVSVIDGVTHAVTATIYLVAQPWGVGVDSATHTVFVADASTNNVTVIDGMTYALTSTFPVGANPRGVGVDPATDTVYVANEGAKSVGVIDGATNALLATVVTGVSNNWVGVDSATDTMYVANTGANTVTVIDGATNTITATIPVGAQPWAVGVDSATDKIYVSNSGSNSVSVINGATNAVTATLGVGSSPLGVTVDPVTDTIYVANSGSSNVSVIDGATNTVTASVPIPVGSGPYDIAVDIATDSVYVSGIYASSVPVIDGATNTVITNISVGSAPYGVAVDSATNTIYVSNLNTYNISVIDGANNVVTTSIAAPADASHLAMDSATDTLYAVGGGRDTLTVFDGATNQFISTLYTGVYPEGLGLDTATQTLYAPSLRSGTVSVFYLGTALWVPPPTSSVPSMDFGQSTSVTFSETGLAGGVGPYSYAWNGLPAGCVSSAARFTCSPSSAAPGTYSVTVTASDASQPSQSRTSGALTFTIFPDPAVTSAPTAAPTSVDLGQAVSFSAVVANPGSGGDVYSWPSGLPPGCLSANAPTLSCTPTAAGSSSIRVFVQDSNGVNVSSPALSFTVHSDPQVSTPAPSQPSVDLGQLVLLSTTASGGSGIYGGYTWSYPAALGCAPSASNVLTCLPTATLSAGTVSVNVIDSNAYTSTNALLSYTVYADPTISSPTASSVSLDLGQSTTLSVTATSGSGLGYSLSWSGLPTGCTSANSSTLTCKPSASGTYTVSASITDSNGMVVVSGPLSLTVLSPLGAPTLSGSATSVDVGGSVTLSVTVSGGGAPYSYHWSGLPQGCVSANTAVQVCSPTAYGSASVTVTVSDSNGVALTSTAFQLVVAPRLLPGSVTMAPAAIDLGQTTKLTAGVSGGSGGLSYAWSGLPPGCSASNLPTLSCTPSAAGSFWVTVAVTDSNGGD